MAHGAPDGTYCTFAGSRTIASWLPAVPCRHESGGLSWRRPKMAEAYLLMVGLVAAATLVRIAIHPYILGTQYPTYFLAAIFSTFIGGVCIGLLSVVLSTLSAWYFIVPPYSFHLVEGEAVSLFSFVAVATLMVFIVGSLQAAHASTERAQGRADFLEERARMAEELQLWGDVFHNAAFGISILDPANTILFANEAYAVAQLMSVDEVRGRSALTMYPPAERERVADLLTTSDRDGHVDYDVDRIRKDGSTFPARVHVTSVRGPNDDVRYRITTLRDITQERQFESELHQSQRLEAIGQLTAGVAHDFNNLLQAVIANLELVDDDIGVPAATREKVSAAIHVAEQGARLTQQLLSFARRQPLSPRKIDLGSYLDEFHGLLARTLDPRIRIEVVTEAGLGPVWADPFHLRNALLNVALNARDAMPSGGHLRIEVSRRFAAARTGPFGDNSDGFAVIRVADTGTGISHENLARVCDPFFSTKGLNGTGLGLSMVHGFTMQSGGDLRITSEPGKGTNVELWLPVAPVNPGGIAPTRAVV
jgi:PAS domain S-box-containing protein